MEKKERKINSIRKKEKGEKRKRKRKKRKEKRKVEKRTKIKENRKEIRKREKKKGSARQTRWCHFQFCISHQKSNQ